MHRTRHDYCFLQHLCIARYDAGLHAVKTPADAPLRLIVVQPPREAPE